MALGLLIPAAGRAQGIIYVDSDAQGANDGSSWQDAYTDLQLALIPSPSGCSQSLGGVGEVWVAEGTYRPDHGLNNRDDAFRLRNHLEIYGGFTGNEVHRDQRDAVAHPTVLSGDLGIPGDASDNSFHVVVASGTDASAVLDGFHIVGGSAVPPGGVRDRLRDSGGGLFIEKGNPTIRSCVFSANRALFGGAVAVVEGAPSFESCRFDNNHAQAQGGGMAAIDASPQCRRCRFENNRSDIYGGGFGAAGSSSPLLVDTWFIGNSASNGGGAHIANYRPVFANCRFLGNRAEEGGGGLYSSGSSQIVNSVFSGNLARIGAGMVSVVQHQDGPVVSGTTFSNNRSASEAGGLSTFHSGSAAPPRLINSILWRNLDASGFQEPAQVRSLGPLEILHSDIQGWTGIYGGRGNFAANPAFEDALGPDNSAGTEDDDLRLAVRSPCIDAADPSLLPPDEADLDGDGDRSEPISSDLTGAPRINSGGALDLGPFEAPDMVSRDVRRGEAVVLNPGGGADDPMSEALVELTNIGGADPASVTVRESPTDLHPNTPGFAALGRTLQITTNLSDGQFFMTIKVPFTAGDLGGVPATSVDLRYFDPATSLWELAVAKNTMPSPGHAGPVGDRFQQIGATVPILSTELGDYGVFWSSSQGRGFAWANVDHSSDYALAVLATAAVLEADCNRNGLADADDIATGQSPDCDASSVPDGCEVAARSVPDCNGNAVPDACDIVRAADGDCDFNGTPDSCDLAQGATDLDGDRRLDVCARIGTCGDVNRNGVIDLGDYSAFHAALAGPGQPVAPGKEGHDLDADRDVDLQDFLLFSERMDARPGFPPECQPNGPVLRATTRCLPVGGTALVEVETPPLAAGSLILSLVPEGPQGESPPPALAQRRAPLDGSVLYQFSLPMPGESGLYLAIAQLFDAQGREIGKDGFLLGARPDLPGIPESICTFELVQIDPGFLRLQAERASSLHSLVPLEPGPAGQLDSLTRVMVPASEDREGTVAAPALYRGRLDGDPSSEVRWTFANGRFYSMTLRRAEDGDEGEVETVYIEPAGIYQPGVPDNLYIVYSSHAVGLPPVLDSMPADQPATPLAAVLPTVTSCPRPTIDIDLFYDHDDPNGLRFRDFNNIAGIFAQTLGVTLRLRRERRLSSDAYRDYPDLLQDFSCDRFAQVNDADVALLFTFNPRRFSYDSSGRAKSTDWREACLSPGSCNRRKIFPGMELPFIRRTMWLSWERTSSGTCSG